MNTRASAFAVDEVRTNEASFVDTPSKFSVDSVLASIRNFATVSEALRMLGAIGILASMTVFLHQGWSDGNDISRYFLLLAQTGLLAAAGFAMSHIVRETKGARLFFGLALVSIPANFTILGALLYSVFQWDIGLATYPGYAEWRIEDVATIGMTMGVAALVLVPVTMFCFAIMARKSAMSLSWNFLLLNALLLLPIRGSVAAGSIALAGVVYALFITTRLTQQNLALKTGEGKFALAALYIPLGIILFRSMYFYHVDSLMVAMVGTALFLAARQASLFPDRSPRLALLLEFASWPLALLVAMSLTIALESFLASALLAPVFVISLAALTLDIKQRTDSRILGKTLTASLVLATTLSFTLSVVALETGLSALLCIVAGSVLLAWGASGRKRGTLIAGLLTTGTGALFGFDALMQLIAASSWIELALFGTGAIALGSVLDRHGVAIKLRISRWYDSTGRDRQEDVLDS